MLLHKNCVSPETIVRLINSEILALPIEESKRNFERVLQAVFEVMSHDSENSIVTSPPVINLIKEHFFNLSNSNCLSVVSFVSLLLNQRNSVILKENIKIISKLFEESPMSVKDCFGNIYIVDGLVRTLRKQLQIRTVFRRIARTFIKTNGHSSVCSDIFAHFNHRVCL